MNATELMIGDWVYVGKSEPYPGKIDLISQNCVELISYSKGKKLRTYNVDYDSISPIPLTGEILEKNGFVKCNERRYDLMNFCFRVFTLDKYENYPCNIRMDDSSIDINYVHELQHVLRFFECSEYADIFTV